MWVIQKNITWLQILVTGGRSLPRILERVAFATALGVGVTTLHRLHPEYLPALTPTPFLLIGLPLGIFLGFRNTAAYDRFWEGRKLWGALVNSSRSLARQVMTAPAPSLEAAPRREAAREVAAFAHALRTRLRDEKPEDAERLLSAGARDGWARWSAAGGSAPLFVLDALGRRFAEWRVRGVLSDITWLPLEQSLVALTDILGACERIKNTPIPYSYTVLMHRIVALYCVLLPLGIADTVKTMTPVVVFFVSYALFGLDAVGEEIEQPFGHDPNDLPLARLCQVIESDVLRLAAEPVVASNAEPAVAPDIEM